MQPGTFPCAQQLRDSAEVKASNQETMLQSPSPFPADVLPPKMTMQQDEDQEQRRRCAAEKNICCMMGSRHIGASELNIPLNMHHLNKQNSWLKLLIWAAYRRYQLYWRSMSSSNSSVCRLPPPTNSWTTYADSCGQRHPIVEPSGAGKSFSFWVTT